MRRENVMKGRNYDVLLLRPQEIKDVIEIDQAIDLVEQGYREAQGFPIINAPRRRVHSRENVRISNFPGGVDGLGVIGSLTRGEQVAARREQPGLSLSRASGLSVVAPEDRATAMHHDRRDLREARSAFRA